MPKGGREGDGVNSSSLRFLSGTAVFVVGLVGGCVAVGIVKVLEGVAGIAGVENVAGVDGVIGVEGVTEVEGVTGVAGMEGVVGVFVGVVNVQEGEVGVLGMGLTGVAFLDGVFAADRCKFLCFRCAYRNSGTGISFCVAYMQIHSFNGLE